MVFKMFHSEVLKVDRKLVQPREMVRKVHIFHKVIIH